MNFKELEKNFKNHVFINEDDIKLHFFAEIIKPILEEFNPNMVNQYKSEYRLISGGRTDATFQNIYIELKRMNKFATKTGIDEALYGRDPKDHGLYDYLISGSNINNTDSIEIIIRKLRSGIGVGFDGNKFIFSRFIPSITKKKINCSKVSVQINESINLDFIYEIKEFHQGLKKLALIFKQQEKCELNKANVLSVINTKSEFVRSSIMKIYEEIRFNLTSLNGSNRVNTLYKEWDRVFGIMYGEDADATDFTEVSSKIREAYGISDDFKIDSKMYLFSMQTFFNIFLKLLIYSFLSQLVDPSFSVKQELTKAEIDKLFDGTADGSNKLVNNFFEAHFLEWFTYTDSGFEEKIINDTLKK